MASAGSGSFFFFFQPISSQTEYCVTDAAVGTIYKVFIKFPLACNATRIKTLHHDVCKQGNILFQKAVDPFHMSVARRFISMHCCQIFPLTVNHFYKIYI